MEFDFEKIGWVKKENGWMHPDQIVATYGIKTGSYVYQHNKGKLRPLSDYVDKEDEQSQLTLGYFEGSMLKAGESHFKFLSIYNSIKKLGRVNLKELYIKEQLDTESITSFLYKDTWFVLAPCVNLDKEKERKILEPK